MAELAEVQLDEGETELNLEMEVAAIEPNRDVSLQRIKFLEERLASSERQNDEFKKLLAESANFAVELKKSLQEHKSSACERSNYIRNIEEENLRFKKDCDVIKHKAQLNEQLANNLGSETKRLAKQLAIATERIEMSKNIVGEIRLNNIDYQNELTELKDKLRSTENECFKLRSQVQKLKGGADFYAEIENALVKERDEMSVRLAQLEIDVSALIMKSEIQVEEAEQERHQFAQLIQEKNDNLQAIRDELNTVCAQKQTLTEEVQKEIQQRKQLQEQLNELSGNVANEHNQLVAMRQDCDAQLEKGEQKVAILAATLSEVRQKAQEEITQKDAELLRLNNEMEQLNEKVRIYAKICNAENPEIMAPAAAITAKLMKNTSSLTELYAKHFGLVVELENKKSELAEAEKTLVDVRRMFVEKIPILQKFEEQLQQSTMTANALQAQIDTLKLDRKKIVANRDAYYNELQFVKSTLEKSQRECQALSKQVQHLVSMKNSLDANTAEVPTDSDSLVFSDVPSLQQKNLELISRIQTIEVEKEDAIRNAHSEQFEALENKLEMTQRQLESSELNNKYLTTCNKELEKQRDYHKKLHKDLQNRMDECMEPARVAEIQRNLNATISRAELAEQMLSTSQEELAECENRTEQKLAAREEVIAELRKIIASLEETGLNRQSTISSLLTQHGDLSKQLATVQAEFKTLKEHARIVEEKGRVLIEKNRNIKVELDSLRHSKSALEKELTGERNALRLCKLELENVKELAEEGAKMECLLNELTSVLDRKTLLENAQQGTLLSSLKTERDQLQSKVEELEMLRATETDRLKIELANNKQQCEGLRIECELAQKNIEPLQIENDILRSQCKEQSAELISMQKSISESQMCKVNEKMAMSEIERLQKEVQQALETADYWKNCYEKFLTDRANNGELGLLNTENEQCFDPSHAAIHLFVEECKKRLKDSQDRHLIFFKKIGELEIKIKGYEEDWSVAENMTTTQLEQINQLETKLKELTDKYNEVYLELQTITTERNGLRESFADCNTRLQTLEDMNARLNADYDAEENKKNDLILQLNTKDLELMAETEKLKEMEIQYKSEKENLQQELTGAQQREMETAQSMFQLREEIQNLQAHDNATIVEFFKRILSTLCDERVKETTLRFNLNNELQYLSKERRMYDQNVDAIQQELQNTNNQLQQKTQLVDEFTEKINAYNSLQTTLNDFEKEKNKLCGRLENFEVEKSELVRKHEQELQSVQEQLNTTKKALEEGVERENEFKEKFAKLQEGFKRMKTQTENYHNLRQLATKLRNEKDEAEARVKQLQEQLTNAIAETEKAVAAATAAANAASVAKVNLDMPIGKANVEKELQNRTKEVLEMSKRNQTLQAEMEDMESKMNQLQEKIIELEKENGDKLCEIIERKNETELRKSELDAANMRNDVIASSLTILKEKYERKCQEFNRLYETMTGNGSNTSVAGL